MRVGIDATAMPLKRTGAGNYTFNLIRALSRVDSENAYVVFAKTQHVRELGVTTPNFTFVPIDLSLRAARLLWEQARLPMHVRRYRLDVLHSPHYTMPLFCPCRRVVTFHDATFFLYPELHQRVKRVFFRRVIAWSGRHADQLIAVSESTRRDILARCEIAPSRIHTVHIAASPDLVPSSPSAIADGTHRYGLVAGRYILFVGVLEPRKNVPRLVEAFGRLASTFPDLQLAIAGRRGWMYDTLFSLVRELGLEEHVRFLDYVPDDALAALYGGARAFAYPSRYEGFGIPILEAMQCGAPVVTGNMSSLPEIAGDAALLVDPDDTDALASALRRVVTDDDLARSLRQRGFRRASCFSWNRTAEATLAVYRRALGRDG
jgi:glycosyltransferase involved in cell wall biosynthesis